MRNNLFSQNMWTIFGAGVRVKSYSSAIEIGSYFDLAKIASNQCKKNLVEQAHLITKGEMSKTANV